LEEKRFQLVALRPAKHIWGIKMKSFNKNIFTENKTFLIICICGMLFNLSYTSLTPIMPSYFGMFGVGTITISYIFSIYGFGRTALQIPAGIIADFFGYKKILMLSLIVLSVLFYLQTLFMQPLIIAAIYILEGFVIGIITPLIYSFVGALVNKSKKGKEIGTYSVFSSLGSAIGPLIGGAIISRYSNYKIVFLISTFSVFGAFILSFKVSEIKIIKEQKTKENVKLKKICKTILGIEFIVIGCLAMLGDFICSSLTSIFPIYGDSILKMPLTYISFILSLNFLVFSFSGPFMGKLCDKIGSKKLVLISLIIEVTTFIILKFVTNPYIFIGIIFIEFLAGSAMYIALQSLLVEYGNKTGNRGFIYGIIGTLQGFGLVIGPVYSGYVYDYNNTFYFWGMAFPCCFALLLFAVKNYLYKNSKERVLPAKHASIDAYID
jgi:DHA1 family multidrug resistance protein-like MFS transporter